MKEARLSLSFIIAAFSSKVLTFCLTPSGVHLLVQISVCFFQSSKVCRRRVTQPRSQRAHNTPSFLQLSKNSRQKTLRNTNILTSSLIKETSHTESRPTRTRSCASKATGSLPRSKDDCVATLYDYPTSTHLGRVLVVLRDRVSGDAVAGLLRQLPDCLLVA